MVIVVVVGLLAVTLTGAGAIVPDEPPGEACSISAVASVSDTWAAALEPESATVAASAARSRRGFTPYMQATREPARDARRLDHSASSGLARRRPHDPSSSFSVPSSCKGWRRADASQASRT
jgi:hypothetical protein